MRRTYQYKAYVSKGVEARLFHWLDLCRDLYNCALSQRIINYRQFRKSPTRYDQNHELLALKDEFLEYHEVGSHVLQQVILRLDRAYQAFFRRVKQGGDPGFPRFRGRDRYDSFTLDYSGWELDGKYLTIKKVGRLRLKLSRPIEGDIKTITVKHSASGWFVSFSCDNVSARPYPEAAKEVGIDVGLTHFAVDSDGGVIDNPRFFKESEAKIAKCNQALSRKVRGSNNRIKAKLAIGKAHEKVANQRKDFAHKTARYYVLNYGVIAVEGLKIQEMVGNKRLAKSIHDVAWGQFFDALTDKAEEAGRSVVKVNPRGTTQNCSGCGERVPKKLWDRTHRCPACGLVLDRDVNASRNILRLGQSHLGVPHDL